MSLFFLLNPRQFIDPGGLVDSGVGDAWKKRRKLVAAPDVITELPKITGSDEVEFPGTPPAEPKVYDPDPTPDFSSEIAKEIEAYEALKERIALKQRELDAAKELQEAERVMREKELKNQWIKLHQERIEKARKILEMEEEEYLVMLLLLDD